MSKALEAAARAAFLHARTGSGGYCFADDGARAFWEQAMARGITAYLRAVEEDEVALDRATSAIAKRKGCDKGTFTVCWGEHERGEVCGCKEDARAALSALEPRDERA